jgi:glutaredoxin-like protein NrdH
MTHAQTIQAIEDIAVVLYGKPRCVQCDATERKFKKEGVTYAKVDVSKDETALDFIKSLGYSQAPVVYVSAPDGDAHWSGYDVYEIAEHITHRSAAA